MIEAAAQYDLPPGHVFTFDEQPGEEKLFVVVSRPPVGDLESLIYDLGSQKTGTPATPPKPAEKTKVLLAQNGVTMAMTWWITCASRMPGTSSSRRLTTPPQRRTGRPPSMSSPPRPTRVRGWWSI